MTGTPPTITHGDHQVAPSERTTTVEVHDRPLSWVESHRFVPRTFVQPGLGFLRQEAAGGIVMLLAAIAAIAWANSPASDGYFALFGTKIEIAFGEFHFHHLSELTVQEWINDALMAIFFFVVGLEIKRELVVGELRDPKAAALPAVAALGGMAVPAGIYLLVNTVLLPEAGVAKGWGIPMATDIAFAVGIVSLAGRKVPVAAKLFLLALAIVDDLGAIIVIALFYTAELSVPWLVAAAVGLLVVHGMKRVDVRSIAAYVVVGAFVWLATLESGVHATVAGVALALMTPVAAFYDPRKFAATAAPLVARVDAYLPSDKALHEADHHTIDRVQSIIDDLQRLARESLPPLSRLQFRLASLSSFIIVPLFAFANAGVVISGEAIGGAGTDPIMLGVLFGLLVGKVVGVTGGAWIAVRLGIGRMPARTTWRHLVGLGLLAGIGFTVALFVAALSFDDPSQLDSAKIGIFAASLLAGVAGFAWLRACPEAEPAEAPHEPVHTG